MKKLVVIAAVFLSLTATSCTKDSSLNPGTDNNTNTGIHIVDSRLVGKWLWTEGSNTAYYDDNGVYNGAAYGLAMQYSINADGSGTCFNHIYSTLGVGSYLEVNISYKGFFESDDQGHLGFFPTSGTYKSSSGTNRALRADELWNIKTKTGRNILSQQLVFATEGGRDCFHVTASNGVVDTFFKIP